MRLTARLIIISLCFLIIPCFVLCKIQTYKFPVSASGNLDMAQDLLSNGANGIENVEHSIRFVLPENSQKIQSSDYIIILLSSFGNITVPTGMSGTYYGTPQYSVDQDNHEVKITGIYVNPGNEIRVSGITATNPPADQYYNVSIRITEDEDGLIIKNIANFYASTFDGLIAVTATIQPPVASLRIEGSSAPGTFITLTENGTVIGTDTANEFNGHFSKYLTGLSGANHNISIYGVDMANLITSPLNFTVYTPIYQETTVSNLLLPPTIQINASEIIQGDLLVASGSAIPNGNISLFTESPLSTYYATASAAGAWGYTITDTATYTVGDYRIYALVQNQTGSQSLFSNSLQFTVRANSGPTPSPAACDISEGDLNCDDQINLIDFSILMYYWGTADPAADINADSLVNLIDFSVMMYYWGT